MGRVWLGDALDHVSNSVNQIVSSQLMNFEVGSALKHLWGCAGRKTVGLCREKASRMCGCAVRMPQDCTVVRRERLEIVQCAAVRDKPGAARSDNQQCFCGHSCWEFWPRLPDSVSSFEPQTFVCAVFWRQEYSLWNRFLHILGSVFCHQTASLPIETMREQKTKKASSEQFQICPANSRSYAQGTTSAWNLRAEIFHIYLYLCAKNFSRYLK